MDASDRKLFEDSLRELVRAHSGSPLDKTLAEVGWNEALIEDPRIAISALFEAQGAANATSSALGDVVAAGCGQQRAPGQLVVLPPAGAHQAPGEVFEGALRVRGLAAAGLDSPEQALVIAQNGDGHVALTLHAADLKLHELQGLDPAAGWLEVIMSGDLDALAPPRPVMWSGAVAAGQLAVAHELIGVGTEMLQLARGHALTRVQFGRPIAQFQAVRHRLAEAYVAIEGARAAADAAWEAPSPIASTLAKAAAGRAARTVARHAQQVLAGIGFTTEHDFHRHLRRVMVLDSLFGSSRTLAREIGAQVIADRRLPPMLAL